MFYGIFASKQIMVNYTKVHGCSSYTYYKYTERKWYSWSTNVQGINLFAFIVIFTVHVVSLVLVFVFRCPLCRLYVCLFVCLFFWHLYMDVTVKQLQRVFLFLLTNS